MVFEVHIIALSISIIFMKNKYKKPLSCKVLVPTKKVILFIFAIELLIK